MTSPRHTALTIEARCLAAGGAMLLGIAATPAAAQSFNYPNFASTAGLQLNGAAAVATDASGRSVLRLTPPTFSQAGSAFSLTQIALAANASFSTAFTFNINQSGFGGADGFVFVVQPNANNVGSAGGGIGYQGIANSLGVEFDTFDNGEINGNHIGIDLNGNINSVSAIASPFVLESGSDLTAYIDYNGATQTLEVRLTDGNTRPTAALLTYSGLNLAQVLGGNSAYVGFTSATGGAYSAHDIVNWRFNDSFAPITSGVPEPATWAMMLLGFGGLGYTMRRRPATGSRIRFA